MSNVKVRFASAFLLSVTAGVGLMMGPISAAPAPDSCITEPKSDSPQGKHWYYRIERGTGRPCWYLRDEDETSARTPRGEPVAAAKPAPSTTAATPARSLADARAEFTPKAPADDNGSAPPAASVWPDPQPTISAPAAPAPAAADISPGAGAPAAPAQSQLASRWPQASGAPAPTNASPQPALMVADAQPAEAAAAPAGPAGPPQASALPSREVGSLQKLALVAFGALALAGISGSLIYRLAGARRRRRHETRWPQRNPAPSLADEVRGEPWIAPELSPTVPHVDGAYDDVVPEDETADRIDLGKNDDSFEKIEDFLARLTKQLQDELQNSRSAELENPRPQ
jgi:hypothetical protein